MTHKKYCNSNCELLWSHPSLSTTEVASLEDGTSWPAQCLRRAKTNGDEKYEQRKIHLRYINCIAICPCPEFYQGFLLRTQTYCSQQNFEHIYSIVTAITKVRKKFSIQVMLIGQFQEKVVVVWGAPSFKRYLRLGSYNNLTGAKIMKIKLHNYFNLLLLIKSFKATNFKQSKLQDIWTN